jgi:hypothetical protein
MADTGVAVIGAGVVGLAVAARLAPTSEVVILERRARHGQETSSRNSEVIHGGMYYPTGSLRRACAWTATGGLRPVRASSRPHARVGKLTVPNATRLPKLTSPAGAGQRRRDDAAQRGETGHGAARPVRRRALLAQHRDRERTPSWTACCTWPGRRARSCSRERRWWACARWGRVAPHRREGDERARRRGAVVNAAGLESGHHRGPGRINVTPLPTGDTSEGQLFSVRSSKANVVSRLVYPVPGHVSLAYTQWSPEGRLRFGPDAEYLSIAPRLPGGRESARLATSVRRLVPSYGRGPRPDMAGIRPKLQGQGVRDFVIAEESSRGQPGSVSLVASTPADLRPLHRGRGRAAHQIGARPAPF